MLFGIGLNVYSDHIYIIITDPSLKIMTSGPYGLIFSSFVPFYFDIPVSARFRMLGFQFSNKSFIYLAGLQVMPIKCGHHLFQQISIIVFSFSNFFLFTLFSQLISISCSFFCHPGKDLCYQGSVVYLQVYCTA